MSESFFNQVMRDMVQGENHDPELCPKCKDPECACYGPSLAEWVAQQKSSTPTQTYIEDVDLEQSNIFNRPNPGWPSRIKGWRRTQKEDEAFNAGVAAAVDSLCEWAKALEDKYPLNDPRLEPGYSARSFAGYLCMLTKPLTPVTEYLMQDTVGGHYFIAHDLKESE